MSGRQKALRLALHCYPRRYRIERGAEIADVFAETTEAAGRLARARELYGVAAYGSRLRLGLTSSQPAGRLFGTAAPLVAGAWAGISLLGLYIVLTDGLPIDHLSVHAVLWYAQYVLAGPALLAALFDRWTLVRGIALLAAGATVLLNVGWAAVLMPDGVAYLPGWVLRQAAPLVWPLLLLAAPRDLLDLDLRRAGRRGRWPALALAPGAGIVSVVGQTARVASGPLTPWAELGATLALILVTVAVLRRGALTLPVLALSVFSLLGPLDDLRYRADASNGELLVLPLALAALVELRRRRQDRVGTGAPLG
ncbi:hypothetical protein [Kitasatospora sp. NBC_01266]|uniref:hypothetical protein n=1 Tax=Kitasatospora sp. NBC_01266 TaxID=2903572 RepID=UPI002E322D57|nr:hypothetical protein [Kitasatospora sp. NBC_01266]